MDRSPLSPSTITLRASCSDAPTSAIRASGLLSATLRTHSAPSRVFPNPRPAMTSHTRQSPAGACWLPRPQTFQS
ncbi:MAG: hypothetical protein B7Y74_02220 [Novosphingobium sp. 35-62-5]|nr:MAG: hypothetical protein B7Y74_02220 [Novosphingobium sp. 35-62-5]